jgi:hypothetical protein
LRALQVQAFVTMHAVRLRVSAPSIISRGTATMLHSLQPSQASTHSLLAICAYCSRTAWWRQQFGVLPLHLSKQERQPDHSPRQFQDAGEGAQVVSCAFFVLCLFEELVRARKKKNRWFVVLGSCVHLGLTALLPLTAPPPRGYSVGRLL